MTSKPRDFAIQTIGSEALSPITFSMRVTILFCDLLGLEDSAQGFNPGKRPPGRRALKGRQIRRRRNGREEHIYLGAASAPFCAGAHYFRHWEIVSLPNKYPLPFSLAIGRMWPHVISRPFRANRFFGCFPGLKPWAESYSPCGAKKTSQTASSSCHSQQSSLYSVASRRSPSPETSSQS